MATGSTTSKADDAAATVEQAGQLAGSKARQAGARVGDAAESAGADGAAGIRRGARRGTAAYERGVDAADDRIASLQDTIRGNPLAAAGAALLVGVVLGRFIL